ncbi:MAG: hypothetical protein EOP00_24750 [Pedobacter sp.]|nr:MAG: hypothetical protein EOP00_24750 [Pedobacter sp.]
MPNVLLRYLSFASFELPRFIGSNTPDRIAFANRNIWSVLFIIFTLLAGLLQTGHLIISFFVRKDLHQWKAIKLFTIFSILLVYLSFLFSVKGPASHTFLIMLPPSMIYAFYCWDAFLQKKKHQRLVAVFLFSGILVHIAIASDNFRRKSMYVNREIPAKAIQQKDYTILGKRRYE